MKPNENDSIRYYLTHAFDYEIRNNIDVRLAGLAKKIPPLSEAEIAEIELLRIVREYLEKRKGALKP